MFGFFLHVATEYPVLTAPLGKRQRAKPPVQGSDSSAFSSEVCCFSQSYLCVYVHFSLMCISQEAESAVLGTPNRKQQHSGLSALELFTAALDGEVEPPAGCSQEMYYIFSGNDVVTGKVEEVTTSAK